VHYQQQQQIIDDLHDTTEGLNDMIDDLNDEVEQLNSIIESQRNDIVKLVIEKILNDIVQ